MSQPRWLCRAALTVATLVSSLAFAQGSSVITGIVNDAATGKPVPDVVITAKAAELQGENVVITDSAGLYRLPQLPAGTYTLSLEKESYKPFVRSEVVVKFDRTVRVNIQLQPEAVQGDTVVVLGTPPTVDVGSTSTGINVGKDFINNIAFIRPNGNGVRSFESLASVAPQVQSDTYGYGFSGATSAENQVYLDGMGVNDAQLGTNGATLPVDFISEVNVITGGYMAEFGRAGGGVVSAVTKSGSNEFHGSVFANYTPGLLAPSSPSIDQAGVSQIITTKTHNIVDFGAELGGPIIKDKLWFYAGISPTFNRVKRTRTLQKYQVDVDGMGNESYATDEAGDFKTTKIDGYEQNKFDDRRGLFYIGKLTYNVASNHSLSLSVMGGAQDRFLPYFNNRVGAGQVFNDTNTTTALKYAGAFFDRTFLVDATAGWFHAVVTPGLTSGAGGLPADGSTIGGTTGAAGTPAVILRQEDPPLSLVDVENVPSIVADACNPAAGTTLTPCPVTGAGLTYTKGGYGFMQLNKMDRFQGRATFTALVNALGHHVIKFGIDAEHARYNTSKAYSGGVTSQQSTDGASYLDSRRYAYLSGPDQLTNIPVVNVTPTTNQFGAFAQNSWAIMDVITLNLGLRWDTQQLYDATNKLGMSLNNMWSPRAGLIYDFTQQGRSKLYANYARYYQSIPLNIADRALSGENQASLNRACDATDPNALNSGACVDPTNYISNGSTTNPSRYARVTGQGRTPVDPALEAQSKDEIVVGGEYEVISNLRLGASYTHSWTNKVIEDMSNDEGNTYFIGNPGYGLAKDFPKASRDYDAVTVLASKAFTDGWMAQASYTWSYVRGNWAGFFRPETGQIDPGTNSDFDLKSLLDNRIGPLPGDKTHFIKAYVSKEFNISQSFSFQLGLTYEGSSGVPVSYLGAHPLYGADEAFIAARGAAGRTPWVHRMNAKIGAGYHFDKNTGIQFTVDFLNMFNFAAATAVDETYTSRFVLPYLGKDPQTALCANGASGCTTQVREIDENGAEKTDPLPVDAINKNFKRPSQYQAPLQVRFGIKLTF